MIELIAIGYGIVSFGTLWEFMRANDRLPEGPLKANGNTPGMQLSLLISALFWPFFWIGLVAALTHDKMKHRK